MAERVYPSSRPGVQNVNGAYTKGQMYGASLPAYRPEPEKRRNRFGLCCLWFTIILVVLILLLGIAAFVLWFIYRPHTPKFSVETVQITRFNVTKNSHLNSEVILQIKARNPNKKITFFYDQTSVKVSSNDVDLVDGSFPGFFHGRKNTTILKTDLKTQNLALEASDAKTLKSDQSKGKISLDVHMDTHLRFKMGKWKSHKIRIKVNCNGVSAPISNTKKPSAPKQLDSKCKLKLKFKFFKW
eukprot:Gb_13977 [translate_table: standard]